MITSRIQIENGPIWDFYKKFGFIYMEADKRTEAPIKKRDSVSYAEEDGEHMDPRTVMDAFDFKAKFLIECPNRDFVNANSKIAAFNKSLYTREAKSDIRKYKEIIFFDDYHRTMIVGIPEPISVPTEFYRRQDGSVMDCVVVELNIHVCNPQRCKFDIRKGYATVQETMRISLETDGNNIYVRTSRPMNSDEHPVLLRKGSATRFTDIGKPRRMSRHRWQVYSIGGDNGATKWPFMLSYYDGGHGLLAVDEESTNSGVRLDMLNWFLTDRAHTPGNGVTATIYKSCSSTTLIPAMEGRTARICYGIAVYSGSPNRPKRVSNVAYFRSNMKMLRDAANGEDYGAMEQWFSV